MANAATPGTYRTSTEIMTRRGGVFWGVVLLLFGILWLLQSLGFNILGQNFVNIAVPFLIIVGGLYLLVTKLLP